MAKKKLEKPHRQLTKRELSHRQRQKKGQRIALGLGLFIIATVLGIVAAGWYTTQYRPLHQTVIKVNDAEFDMNYYIKILRYYGKEQPASYMYSLADGVVKIIEQNELVRQGAIKLGISVSDKAVDKELKRRNPPLSKDYRDLVRTEMLASKLRDEYFGLKIPVSAEQRHIMAMLLESESQAKEIRAKLESSGNFTALAKELSVDGFSKIRKGDLGWRPKDVLMALLNSSIPGEYAFSAEVGILSQPIYDEVVSKGVGYWLIKVQEREEKRAHVQVILLGNGEEAQKVKARVEAGEDFAALAEEFSQDDFSRRNGGDVGWVDRDIMSPAFKEFVFKSKLQTLSEPIRDEAVGTTGGYWLIKVLDINRERKIPDEDRELLKTKALNDWVLSLRNDPENKVESYLDDEKMAWAIQQVMKDSKPRS